LKLVLRKPGGDLVIDAIAFFVDQPECWLGLRQIKAAYKLDINEFRGNRSVQFILQYLEKLT
ncbi:MAG: single-stranded-DNA-specific exonuclease RecJ, partial [Methylococcaceae bacterium]|nr:single-stranded-DNA-specific exonuclease RecJ [Methylococcaceae bacterium]